MSNKAFLLQTNSEHGKGLHVPVWIAQIPLGVVTGLALLVLHSQLFAQSTGSGPAVAAYEAIPEAPQPQVAAVSIESSGQPIAASEIGTGSISGTATDADGDLVPGATAFLDDKAIGVHRSVVVNDNGAFVFDGLKPGTPYQVTLSAQGFASWTSPVVVLTPGQFVILKGIDLKIEGEATSVTVSASTDQIAVEQVRIEEQQRVLGFIPNFYVVYDRNAAPLTTKLKFSLALKAETDPVTLAGIGFLAAIYQAADRTDYRQGAAGYGQRAGALYANGFTDIMIGGAILPSLLHQDPRYFYQGTGTNKSRALHALSSPFIAKRDNGRWQPNYSSVGGDLASGAISNAYYPSTNRGPGLVFENALITSGGRMVNGLIQEFILRKFTPSARNRDYLAPER